MRGNMDISFKNQVALVTGAASGIGFETAKAFAEAGAAVALADWNAEAVHTSAKELEKDGHRVVALACDVSKEDQVRKMVADTVAAFGRLDAAFNNAAVQSDAIDTADLSVEEWDRVLNVNIRGVFLCMKYELLRMREQGNGSIVNCSSNSGLVGVSGRAAYSTAKHGMLGLTKCAAIDYAPKGIRINAVCPGTIATPMVEEMLRIGDLDEKFVVNAAPIHRLGTPREIADAVLWLCSPYSTFIIGQAIAVDGGYTIV